MLHPLQGTYLQHGILFKEPQCCNLCKEPFMHCCIFSKEPICNVASFARNLFETLNSFQGTYLNCCILCKEHICNTTSFAGNLSATLNYFAINQMASLTPLTRNLSATFTQIELKQLRRAGKHDCLETWIIAVAIICKNVAAMLASGYSAAKRVFKLDTRTPFHDVSVHMHIHIYTELY